MGDRGFFPNPTFGPAFGPDVDPSTGPIVAAMATTHSPIDALVSHIDLVSPTSQARRACARWGSADPSLAGFRRPAEVAAAIRCGQPSVQDDLVARLLAVGARDELAQLTIVAGLSRRLGYVVARWRRAGVPAGALDQLEADLVAECWRVVSAAGRTGPGGSPSAMAVVQAAWQAARAPRRAELRRAARTDCLDDTHPATGERSNRSREDQMAELVLDAYRGRQVSFSGARLVFTTRVAGLPVSDVAARLGCSPQSVRTRRARAERALARSVLTDAA